MSSKINALNPSTAIHFSRPILSVETTESPAATCNAIRADNIKTATHDTPSRPMPNAV